MGLDLGYLEGIDIGEGKSKSISGYTVMDSHLLYRDVKLSRDIIDTLIEQIHIGINHVRSMGFSEEGLRIIAPRDYISYALRDYELSHSTYSDSSSIKTHSEITTFRGIEVLPSFDFSIIVYHEHMPRYLESSPYIIDLEKINMHS